MKKLFWCAMLLLPLLLVACKKDEPNLSEISYELLSSQNEDPIVNGSKIEYNLNTSAQTISIAFKADVLSTIQVTKSPVWVKTNLNGTNVLQLDIDKCDVDERSTNIEVITTANGYRRLVLNLHITQALPTYNDMLAQEQKTIEFFLNKQTVKDWPSDGNYEIGATASYYRLGSTGVYMQVLSLGEGNFTKGERAFFRFERWNLYTYQRTGSLGSASGNMSGMDPPSNFVLGGTDASSKMWGIAIQLPLEYGIGQGEVNIIIPSQKGFEAEIPNVTPYLMHIRYYKSTH